MTLTDRLKAALAWNEATVNDNADDGKWLGGSHGRAVNTAWKRGARWEHARTEELVNAMVECVGLLDSYAQSFSSLERAPVPLTSLEAALEKMEGGG